MTEDEAKTKWCPFARVGSFQSGLGSINRGCHADGIVRKGPLPEEAMCIGSACMAWRWLEELDEDGTAWRMINDFSRTGRHNAHPASLEGFCGLAGRPS